MLLVLACLAPATAAYAQALPARFEIAVLHELNRARERPAEVARELRRYRAAFRGRIVYELGSTVGTITAEGSAAVDEAIVFLERQHPLPALSRNAALGRVARTLMAEQARTGAVGHVSRHGRGPGERLRAAGGGDMVGETIAYGFHDAAAAVRQLIVDDGVPDRGHRRLLFARDFRVAGVGCATHPVYRRACAVGLATGGASTVYAAR